MFSSLRQLQRVSLYELLHIHEWVRGWCRKGWQFIV